MRRVFTVAPLLLALICSLALISPALAHHEHVDPDATRPNVVLISLDTVRPDHLGAYGYDRDTSPNLDKLAAQGVRFEKVWAQAPWTLPSHMSVFTSMLPSQHRVDSMGRVLPKDTPMLAGILKESGYATVGVVNNGHMRAHWGFNRGFDVWREFQVDTQEGACPNITTQAIAQLKAAPKDKPLFMFVHYYDAHDAYDPPKAFREKYNSTLTGQQAREITWGARDVHVDIPSEKLKQQLIGSYDGEIAWMDHELGRLFKELPENTLVIVFSDHGEAFEEHGRTLHGGALYEEETRVPLIMRMPDGTHAGQVIDQPTMLMDIAPTILSFAGVDAPEHYQGTNVGPMLSGKTMPARMIMSENKAVLEGQFQRSVVAYPWKLVYSAPDGRRELYKLPDEKRDYSVQEASAVEAMMPALEKTLEREDHWMIHVRGDGRHEVTVRPSKGSIALFIPFGFDPQRDRIATERDGSSLRWVASGSSNVKTMLVELSDPTAELVVDVKHNGNHVPGMVTVGAKASPIKSWPARLPADEDRLPVLTDQAVVLDEQAVRIVHHANEPTDDEAFEDNARQLEEEALNQLRDLGYIR